MQRLWVITRVSLVITLLALIFGGYFFYEWQKLRKNPGNLGEEQVQELVAQVGKLIVLPEGEIPTVATVSDPSLLKDQPFFDRAQKGDKVLIYTEAKKAILYSVSLNKIVEVAPLNIGDTQGVTPDTGE